MKERNASNIYKARHALLGLEDDPIEAEIPDTYIIQFGTSNSGVNGNIFSDRSVEHVNNNVPHDGFFSKYLHRLLFVYFRFCFSLVIYIMIL